ncbi:unnamed protein product [Discosporangium mesarthrocarpum]
MDLTEEDCEIRQEAERQKRKGNIHFNRQEYDAALMCYTDAIALDGTNHVFFANRSACHAGKKDWCQAAADARSSVQLCDSYVKGHYRLAQALLELGKLEEASAALHNGLCIEPGEFEFEWGWERK